jgi:hypothetical protein
LNFGKRDYFLEENTPFLRLTFHRVQEAKELDPPTRLDRIAYEAGVRRDFDKWLDASFMNLEKAAEKGSKRFTEDMKTALLKYLPIAVIMLAILTFLLNFGVLSIASRAMPYDVVQLRAQALTENLGKEINQIRLENNELRQQLAAIRAELQKKKR